ncbi:LacI family transcriptional regulator OS=Streptomyces alboniger OX=132473 GN=CP975_09850 PE=4 SV=1 [Streptomyces alboniger]
MPVLRKIEGFQLRMRERFGLTADASAELIEHSLYTLEGGQAAADTLIGRGCTAIVAPAT